MRAFRVGLAASAAWWVIRVAAFVGVVAVMFDMLARFAMAQSGTVIDIGYEMTRVTCFAECDPDGFGGHVTTCRCEYKRGEATATKWALCHRGPLDKFLAVDASMVVVTNVPPWGFALVPGLPYHDEVCRQFDLDRDGDVDLLDLAHAYVGSVD